MSVKGRHSPKKCWRHNFVKSKKVAQRLEILCVIWGATGKETPILTVTHLFI
jgi:hypothetical protein